MSGNRLRRVWIPDHSDHGGIENNFMIRCKTTYNVADVVTEQRSETGNEYF